MKRHFSVRLFLPAIFLLALALRLFRIGYQPLWWDEGYSVFFATRDFATMVARTAVDIHPPLYYALLQLWMALAGKADVALRLLSVVIGVATVPLVYLVGRKLLSRRAGLLAAGLLALSPFHVYYSQEVRMYGLVTLLGLASVGLQVTLLGRSMRRADPSSSSSDDRRGRALWLLYVLVTAAAVYTHYFAAFLVAAQALVVVLFAYRRHTAGILRPWLLAWGAIALLALPWVAYAGPKLYSYVTAKVGIEHYSGLDPLTFIGQHLVAFSIGHISQFYFLGLAALLFAGVAGFGTLSFARAQRLSVGKAPSLNPALVLLIYLFVPLVLGWLVNLFYGFNPVRYERLLLLAAPAFYLLVALGLDALLDYRAAAAWAALAGIILISGISLFDFYTVDRYPQEDYRPLIRQMEELARAGDAVLAPYPWQIGYLESYYRGPSLNLVEVPSEEWGADPSKIDPALSALAATSPRVWLIAFQTKGRRLEDRLANFYAGDYVLWDNWYENTRLEYFAKADDPPLAANPVTYESGLQLISYGASPTPVSAGNGFVALRLHWEARSNGYNYSVRLVDAGGQKRAQLDGPISSGNDVRRIGLVVPRSVPPGNYTIRLVVYDGGSGRPLPLPNGETELVLSQVAVTSLQ